ncbi:5-formyltetrahydrofolate cyclo-ligase [Thiorhodococcus fuscus]|uniref:5-formyltetrahydrofolate cyclo-ligase n=1 Tax=Thiorhodococcus fuscus TaxID=527200 RepID=A0ABW4Y9B3_9GAMM
MQSLPSTRRALRHARRALSPREQRRHAIAVARRLRRAPHFLRAHRIAFYWPADGELDPRPLMEHALALGKTCLLPILDRASNSTSRRRLQFVRFRSGDRMRPNRFGIPEPNARGRLLTPSHAIDLIIMPLVGFDERCHRIGMGGGYYDRTLAFLRRRNHWRHPRLIGVAHECQRLERIEPQSWDVPLDAVATESRLYAPKGALI